MKFCKDCEHCVVGYRGLDERLSKKCHRPMPDDWVNLVTGSLEGRTPLCKDERAPRRWWETERRFVSRCGPSGKFWELEKEPPTNCPMPPIVERPDPITSI